MAPLNSCLQLFVKVMKPNKMKQSSKNHKTYIWFTLDSFLFYLYLHPQQLNVQIGCLNPDSLPCANNCVLQNFLLDSMYSAHICRPFCKSFPKDSISLKVVGKSKTEMTLILTQSSDFWRYYCVTLNEISIVYSIFFHHIHMYNFCTQYMFFWSICGWPHVHCQGRVYGRQLWVITASS